jgi:hypothetical protein
MASTAYRFESNWHSVREHRINLLAAAQDGDTDAMWQLHELTRRALLFSIYAVRNPVDLQEAFYANAISGRDILAGITRQDGQPWEGTLGLHVKAVASVDAWMGAHFRLALFNDLTGHTFAKAATKCYGLGVAKAMYAAGCLAFDDAGCLDTHMCEQHGVDQRKIGSWKAYMTAYATTGWRHTLDQWRDFLTVGAFAANQHDTWFSSVLTNAATA